MPAELQVFSGIELSPLAEMPERGLNRGRILHEFHPAPPRTLSQSGRQMPFPSESFGLYGSIFAGLSKHVVALPHLIEEFLIPGDAHRLE